MSQLSSDCSCSNCMHESIRKSGGFPRPSHCISSLFHLSLFPLRSDCTSLHQSFPSVSNSYSALHPTLLLWSGSAHSAGNNRLHHTNSSLYSVNPLVISLEALMEHRWQDYCVWKCHSKEAGFRRGHAREDTSFQLYDWLISTQKQWNCSVWHQFFISWPSL